MPATSPLRLPALSMTPRLYIPLPLEARSRVVLPDGPAHKVREVLRARTGAQLTVFDGRGGEYPGILTRCQRDCVEVELGDRQPVVRESALEITLAQGISRGERMDYTLQKAVELGVTRIVPVTASRSQVKLDGDRAARRLAHWQGIIVHACEQSGRDRLPLLDDLQSLPEFAGADRAAVRLTLAPGARAPLAACGRGARSFSLVIGPEGGLDPREIALLEAAAYQPVRLGPRILRTETAALVALTVLQLLAGDLAL